MALVGMQPQFRQILGRDAAPVQADAAQMFAFHDGHVQPQLRAADGGHVAAGSGADDDKIKCF